MRLQSLTRCCLAALLVLLIRPASAADPQAGAWAGVSRPAGGVVQIFGAHGLGCIAGAAVMPSDGPGWEVVRVSRNRFWGHPALIASLQSLAAAARQAGLPPIWIGDLGQPRGGPMPWGHASHQIGLDADVWLEVSPRAPQPPGARERIEIPSLVRRDGEDIDPHLYSERHALLIRLAAQQPAVERVFVNPAIKRALCRTHGGEAWLRRVRPWYGHDSHMHLRLRCPPGQSACRDQAPLPPGDGCDASLDWWFSTEARHPVPTTRPSTPRPGLPAACTRVLAAP